MAKKDALRKIALALPDAHEEPHFERTSFRVGKKIFATMTPDGREAMVRVFPKERVEALLLGEPEVFFSYGTWTTRNGAIGVRLAKVKTDVLRELVLDSFNNIAPKRLVASASRRTPRKSPRSKK